MVKPWYKQFWPWFLIILPLTVVVWTIVTVVIFSQNSVSLVAEDYYKKGADAKGVYRLSLDHKMEGPWFIELQPHDQKWLVQGRVTFPSSATVLMN